MKSWLIIVILVSGAPAWAADSITDVRKGRLRSGAWAGSSLMMGTLELNADRTNSQIRLTALPTIDLGIDHWPTESTGLYLAGRLGVGAAITTTEDAYLVGEKNSIGALRRTSISYNLHQLEAGARIRWLAGPRADALGLFLGFGMGMAIQTAQEQRPSIVLDRVIAGPKTSVGVEWPLVRRCWLRLTGQAGFPFFVRESPNDSGSWASSRQFGARGEILFNVSSNWAVDVYAEFEQTELDFEGSGSRALGVTNASTETLLLSSGLWLRYLSL